MKIVIVKKCPECEADIQVTWTKQDNDKKIKCPNCYVWFGIDEWLLGEIQCSQ